MIALSY